MNKYEAVLRTLADLVTDFLPSDFPRPPFPPFPPLADILLIGCGLCER